MRANSSKMEKGSKWKCATWIAGLALVVALASLAFTIIQRNELNTYRRLSAKPILLIDRILAPTQGYDGVGIYLRNGGNGIATILGGSVTYGDMRLDHENGPLATIAELIATQNPGFPYITAVGPRFAESMQAGNQVLLLGMDAAEFTPERGAVLKEYIFRIGFRIEYRSLCEDAEPITLDVQPVLD